MVEFRRHQPSFDEEIEQDNEKETLFMRLDKMQDYNSFYNALLDARKNGSINHLEKEQQREVINRLMAELASKLENTEASPFFEVFQTNNALLPSERNYQQDDIVDTYMEMMPEIYIKWPKIGDECSNILDQSDVVVRPEVLIKTYAQLVNQPGLSSNVRSGAITSLSYLASFGLMEFIRERIDNLEKMSVQEASDTLTVLDVAAAYGEQFEFSEKSSKEIKDAIRVFKQRTENALLHRKAEAIVEKEKAGKNWSTKGIRVWMKYNPQDFGLDESQMSDEEVRNAWDDALNDSYFRQQVQHNDFLISKERTEKLHGTNQIEVEGTKRDRVLIAPVSKDYLGVYGMTGKIIRLLKQHGEVNFYQQSEMLHAGELPALSVNGELSHEEIERRLQAQQDFVAFLDRGVLEGIERDYGFAVQELTLKEQIWFVAALRGLSREQEQSVVEIVHKYGIEAARSFLSTEVRPDLREGILVIGERLDQKTAQEIFDQYSKIVTMAQREAQKLVKEFFKERIYEDVNIELIEQALLGRAAEMLHKIARSIESDGEVSGKLILKFLEDYESHAIAFASIFKEAFKGKEHVDFHEIMGIGFEEREAIEISDEDKVSMMKISAENWAEVPHLASYVKKATRKNLYDDSGKTRWRILKKDGNILSFVRIDKTDNPSRKYIGSFNVNKKYRGSALGEAVFNDLIERESEQSVLELHADPRSVVAASYVEKNGFVIIGIDKLNVDENEVPLFLMELNKMREQNFGTVQKELTFDISTQFDQMIEVVEQEVAAGNVVSSYTYNKKNPNIRSLVIKNA